MRDVFVAKKLPETGLIELELAQVALRVGLERAKQLVLDAKLVIRGPDAAHPKPPAFDLAQVE